MRLRLPVILAACATATLLAAAPPVLNESLIGRQVFPQANWWNSDVSGAPVDARSAALIDFISGRTPTNQTAVRRLHPDFGPPPYGIPYVVVSGDQARVPLAFVAYGNESEAEHPDCRAIPSRPRRGPRRTTSKAASRAGARQEIAISW